MPKGFMIAATGSHVGKTTITCAILNELKQQNIRVTSFKCGPDYIDPMFHREIIGTNSYNLDSFFLKEECLMQHFAYYAGQSDIAVVEGVMGYYDGVGYSIKGSSFEIASILNLPVVLVVDGNGMANSILATIKGFCTLQKDSKIQGVILNRVSERTYQALAPQIEQMGLKACGFVPKLKQDLILESRHLGLIQSNEVENVKQKLQALGQEIRKTLEWEKILALAGTYEKKDLETYSIEIPAVHWNRGREAIRIAVAKDEAFTFQYAENLDELVRRGCEPVPFSPLHDQTLPENISGILLMGGYPEQWAKELSENASIMQEIKFRINNNIPVMAECGGYMYLKETIEDLSGKSYPMVGVLPGKCYNNYKLTRFGYVTLEAKKDTLIGPAGTKVLGHEFHYWDCEQNGEDFIITAGRNGEAYDAVYASEFLYAGFPHLYFKSNPQIVDSYVEKCRSYQK